MLLQLPLKEYPGLKNSLLQLSGNYEFFALLDSNHFEDRYGKYQWLAALGAKEVIAPSENSFEALQQFCEKGKRWLFGHFNYDLKNQLEKLHSSNPDRFDFPLLSFWEPQVVIYEKEHNLYVSSEDLHSSKDFEQWLQTHSPHSAQQSVASELKARTSRAQYLKAIQSLKEHLQFGNIYEVNYCMEFEGQAPIAPVAAFQKLSRSSPAPFSAFYRWKNQYAMSSSPERFLCKRGSQLISQPIKGTAARSADPAQDKEWKNNLLLSEKERAENVMIVDLVRNDLSRTAARGSVKVNELFGIYTYPAVHQMISTVSSQLDEKYHPVQAIRYAFPMGSMTGAPKIKAMEIIDEHENFARSLYSGSIGYFDPDGDFDFNVVIRTILYNARTQYLSARVGSAITIHCEAEKEYEECLLKAQKLLKVLSEENTE